MLEEALEGPKRNKEHNKGQNQYLTIKRMTYGQVSNAFNG